MDVNILDYGAVADGKTLNTKAFNDAVLACHKSGGGYVLVPEGTFLSGTIQLLSNVYLNLAPGAVILGSPNYSDFRGPRKGANFKSTVADLTISQCNSLIMADNAKNVGITGFGIIDCGRSEKLINDPDNRPFTVVFADCYDVYVEKVKLINSGLYTVFSLRCERMKFDGVTVDTYDSMNGDGLDFDGGKDVLITNCHLETGDDSIGLKTTDPAFPCENFTVSNCFFRSRWAGVRLGPESAGDYRNISINGCTFENCNDGIKIQCCGNSIIEDILFNGMTMRNVVRPFFISLSRYRLSALESVRPKTGRMRRLTINALNAVMPPMGFEDTQTYCSLVGLEGADIEDVTISNVTIVANGGGTQEHADRVFVSELLDFIGQYPEAHQFHGELPSAVLYMKHAKNVKILNANFICETEDKRPAVCAEDVKNLSITSADYRNCGGFLRYFECPDIKLIFCSEDVKTLTDEQIAVYNANREKARRTDAKLESFVPALEKVDNGTVVLEHQATDKYKAVIDYDYDGNGDIYMYIPVFRGIASISVNGKLAGTHKVEAPYWWYINAFAVCITPYLNKGQNTINIKAGAPDISEGGYELIQYPSERIPKRCGLRERFFNLKSEERHENNRDLKIDLYLVKA